MSQSPTYVSRLDPQFRRFVNVVNVYPSSETSASNDDLSKDGAASLASSSYSEINQEFISVDAYTEENWPPPPSPQRKVSEFYLEYANILSSESETSFGNDNNSGIATYTSTSSDLREGSLNFGNSEQRSSHDRIRNDYFGDDSVFLNDENDEDSHKENGINQCLQKRPVASNKRQTLTRPPVGSFPSEADSESSYKDHNETEGRLEHFGETEGFFAGKDVQWNGSISPVSRRHGQEVISRYPQRTSRQIADSLESLSSVNSELGYVPDVIEDGYSSTSSADSSFMCFALVGKQDDKRTKRKMASKNGRGDRRKKHRHIDRESSQKPEVEDKGSDTGLMACVVTGISGGPAIRVFRDEDSHRSKPKSKPSALEYLRGAQPSAGRASGESTDHNVLDGSQLQYGSSKRSGHDAVFALIAAPGNPSLKEKRSGRRGGEWDTVKMDARGLAGADAAKGVLPGPPGNYTPRKPYDKNKGPQASKSEMRNATMRTGNYDQCSQHDDFENSDRIFEALSSNNSAKGYDHVNVTSNVPGNTTSDHRQSSQDKTNAVSRSNWRSQSKGKVQSSISSKQTGDSPFPWSDEGKRLSDLARPKQMPDDQMKRGITRGDVQGKAVPLKLQISSNAIPKSVSKSQRRERNRQEDKQQIKDTVKNPIYVSELKLQDAKKTSRETDPSWLPRETSGGSMGGRIEDLSESNRNEKMDNHPLSLQPVSGKAFGSYIQHGEFQTTGNLESKVGHPGEEAWLIKDEVRKADAATEAKTKVSTPVRQAIHKTIQSYFLDNCDSDGECELSSNEEDQVCPEFPRERSLGIKSEHFLNMDEDQKAVMNVTKSLESNSGNIMLKGEELNDDDVEMKQDNNIHREIISGKDVGVFIGENQGETSRESLDTITTSMEGISRPAKGPCGADCQPMKESCDDLHNVNDQVTESQQGEIDSRFPRDVVAQLSSSPRPSAQQRTQTPVNKRKHDEDVRQGTTDSEKSKSPPESSPKQRERRSRSKGTERHSVRLSSDTAEKRFATTTEYSSNKGEPENEGKEYKRHSIAKTEQRKKVPFAEDSRRECPSDGNILRYVEEVDNKNNADVDDGEKDSSLVPSFKRTDKEDGFSVAYSQEETSEEKVESLASYGRDCQSYQEDEVAGTSQKTTSAFDAHCQSVKETSDVPEVKVQKKESCLRESRVRDPKEDVCLPSILPSSKEKTSPRVTKRRIYEDKKQDKNVSETTRSGLVPSKNRDDLPSHDLPDPSIDREQISLQESSATLEAGLAKAVEFPGCSLNEGMLDNKEREAKREVLTRNERSTRRSFEERKTKANIDSSTPSSPVLFTGVTVDSDNGLLYSVTKDVTSVPELADKDSVLPTLSVAEGELQEGAASPETYERFDLKNQNEVCTEETLKTNLTHLPLTEKKKDETSLFKDVETTNLVLDEILHPFALSVDASGPEVNAHQGTDYISPVKVEEAAQTSIEKHGVSEDICFVVFDVSDSPSEDGALPTAEMMSSSYLDETTDVSYEEMTLGNSVTRPKFQAVSELHDEVDAFVQDHKEGNEAVCCYEELGYHSQSNQVLETDKVREADSEDKYSICQGERHGSDMESKVQNHSCASKGIPLEIEAIEKTTQLNAPYTVTEETTVCERELVDGKISHSSSQSCTEEKLPLETELNSHRADTPGWTSCNKHTHCACLERYLLQKSNSREDKNSYNESGTSAKMQNPDADSKLEAAEDTQWFGTSKADEITDVREVVDQQCQVALIKVYGSPPECKTKETQTSLSYISTNDECQANGTNGIDSPGKALPQQTVECQTELLTNVLANVGVQVKFSDYHFEDKLLQRETTLTENGKTDDDVLVGQDSRCQYVDKECQTSCDHKMLLSTSKQCQVAFDTEESSRSTDQDTVTLNAIESAHHVSFDSKECQTSENDVDVRPHPSVSSIECQTSGGQTLVTSSAQCEILSPRDIKEDLAAKAILAFRRTSYDDKESQTSLENDLHTASKECQTSPWSYTSEEIEKAGVKNEISYENRECQTLLDTNAASKECQTTFEEFEKAGMDTDIRFQSKECQTLLDVELLLETSKQCQTLSSFTHEEIDNAGVQTEMSYENKDCQTLLDVDLLLETSKQCQTSLSPYAFEETENTGVQTEISYETRECQTLLDVELLLETSKQCQTSLSSCSSEGFETVGLQTEISCENKDCQTSLDTDLLFEMSKQCQTSSWYDTSGEIVALREDNEISYENKECQTMADIDLPLTSSKEAQTMSEFATDGLKAMSDLRDQQYVACKSKECQTEPGSMRDPDYLSTVFLLSTETDSRAQNNSTGSPERGKSTYETKGSQTTIPDYDLLVLTSKLCQTSTLESAIDYHNRESQTLPDGEMFLASSKECQTVPYSLDDLKLLVEEMRGSQDMEIIKTTEAEELTSPSDSPQMGSLHGARRPITYGKSPEVSEVPPFEFPSLGDINNTEVRQTTAELAFKAVDIAFPVDVAEISCQAVLCHCGKFVDEHQNLSSCSRASNDPQNGYFFFFRFL